MIIKFKLFENKYPDVDPYGEENWDDDKPIIVGNLMVSEDLGVCTWYEAIELCKNHRGEGLDDWRLPTKNELNEIYEYNEEFGRLITGSYWSSSVYSTGSAWYQYFDGGLQDYDNKHYTNYVIAVRNFKP